ncbi:MAG: signal peptidase I [Candidatus Nanopelagicales bacterium]|nr:signal peptidase I [Candidatus Nanopelagicales bacterium]MCF8539680.1 signal peptidase I [Candidatus Nanopelagicales bacterium]MCF8550869.1 signal peptidase I [Candidatus Nanopelagicales bacterium]
MSSITSARVETAKARPASKRARIIKVIGAILIGLFVIAPSLLFNFAGVGLSPILTGSMQPGIQSGDVLITKTIPVTDVQVGDVVALVSQETGILYAHRVVEIRDQSGVLRIITKGDANEKADLAPYMASANDLVPKSIAVVPKIGHALVYLTSVQGRQASLALIVTANIIAVFLWLFREQIKEVSDKAYKVYRDLFVEAESARVENEEVAGAFRDLLEEQKTASTQYERQSAIYKDLFLQSQEDKDVNEAEIAQLMNQLKKEQLEKEMK